jgi:hypothetical protein
MRRTIRLSDETMEGIRASEAFRALDPSVAAKLEDLLYNEFGGVNLVSGEDAALRLDRYLSDFPADTGSIRAIILDALVAV